MGLAVGEPACGAAVAALFRPGIAPIFHRVARLEEEGSTRFVIYHDSASEWRWRLVDGNNEIVADSAEGYDSKSNARRAVDNVRGECGGADVEEE